MIASLGIAHLTIYYEDMQQDPQMVWWCDSSNCYATLKHVTNRLIDILSILLC